jgi:hypothetical protein
MIGTDPVKRFLKVHSATAVGATPPRPEAIAPEDHEEAIAKYFFDVERPLQEWAPIRTQGAAAKPGEYPERFIDGSHLGQPVLCLRSPAGYPVTLYLSQVGAVALRLEGRSFVREFRVVESVLGFVVDPFPWEEVEEFTAALANHERFPLRALPARMAPEKNPFDYEVMRSQAQNRCQHEMLSLEVLALRANSKLPTLVDGQLAGRIGEKAAKDLPLLVGLVKAPTPAPLDNHGWNALLDLRAGERTPYFKDTRKTKNKVTEAPLACWYLRLAGGSRMSPNWGVVRVDVPWVHLTRFPEGVARSGFVNRLSRWLVEARCTADSYARMAISLEPIVRAEAALKPLFTPLPVLVNRLYHRTGVFGERGA